MRRREFTFGMAAFAAREPVRAAAFRADVTPALGEPLIWVDPAGEILDPLWAKGVIIDGPSGRVAICAVDWCGVGGWVHRMFRDRLAGAVRTDPSRVAVQTVHQHTAPYIEGGGYELMARLPKPPLMMSRRFLEAVTGRVADAAADAMKRLRPVEAIGVSSFGLERVGSARRLMVDGKLVIRFSGSGKDRRMAELPEGDIDTRLRTVTLQGGGKAVVRLHYYASHPQTFCCNGQVTADFVGAAREEIEREEGVPQIYFTGCAGDVTVGKYNDGGAEARDGLAKRLAAGMRASNKSMRGIQIGGMGWRSLELRLPLNPGPRDVWPPAELAKLNGTEIYRRAIHAAFPLRKEPLTISMLRLGDLRIVHLPGEPMLEFQRHAGEAIVAGYGDISPGYLCPDKAFEEGGYEPSASNGGPGTEAAVKKAITAILSD